MLFLKGHIHMSINSTKGEIQPPERLTPNEYRAELVRKGWTFVELGQYWDMSANWLAKVAGRADRPRYWDDAVRGLPNRISKKTATSEE